MSNAFDPNTTSGFGINWSIVVSGILHHSLLTPPRYSGLRGGVAALLDLGVPEAYIRHEYEKLTQVMPKHHLLMRLSPPPTWGVLMEQVRQLGGGPSPEEMSEALEA